MYTRRDFKRAARSCRGIFIEGEIEANHTLPAMIPVACIRNVRKKIQIASSAIGHTITIATNQPDRDDKLPGAPA